LAGNDGGIMSLKRQTFWSLMPVVSITAISFFSLPLMVRYLGDEMYALTGYIGTLSGMFGFADLGLGVAVGRYIGVALGKGDNAAVRGYWGTGNLIALPLLLFMGVVFAVLGGMFGPRWFQVSPENAPLLRACLIVGGVNLFFNYYAQIWNILLQAHLDFRFSSQLRVVISLLQMLPALAIAWATRNPLWIMLWSAAVSVLQLVAMMWHARRRYGLAFDFDFARREHAREMLPYTLKTFISLIAGSFATGIDRFLLGRLAPAVDFSRYYICTNAGGRVHSLGGSVMGPVFHNTSRAVGSGGKGSAAAIYDEMFHLMFGWCLLAAIWCAIWHPVALRVWLDYLTGRNISAEVSPLFTPVIIAFCFTSLSSVSGAQLGPFDRAGVAVGFITAGGVLTGLGVLVGWRMAGMVGVAYGLLGSRVVCVAQDFYVMRLASARGWLSGQIWLSLLAQGLVGGVFALAYLVLPYDSTWLLLPASLHGALVATWLLRHPLGKLASGLGFRWQRSAAN
jgi:O-antigen/teichoic acid export membrane protein